MPAKSKAQQRFFGMVHQCKKTGKCASPEIKKVADEMKDKYDKKNKKTKHKGLPEKKVKESMTFKEFLMNEANQND